MALFALPLTLLLLTYFLFDFSKKRINLLRKPKPSNLKPTSYLANTPTAPNKQYFTTFQKFSCHSNNNNLTLSSSRSSAQNQIYEKPNHHARNCYNQSNMDSYPPNRSSNHPQANMVAPSADTMSPSTIVKKFMVYNS